MSVLVLKLLCVLSLTRRTMLTITLQTRDIHGVVCLTTGTCYARDLFSRVLQLPLRLRGGKSN